jgi:hypothetical protein
MGGRPPIRFGGGCNHRQNTRRGWPATPEGVWGWPRPPLEWSPGFYKGYFRY